MANRIKHVRISQRSLSPVEADLLIEVDADAKSPDFELRGRLVGPTCPYSSTIEVAYPLRMLPLTGETSLLHGRVVMPEPSWWDPTSPFLYRGRIELWQADRLLESTNIRYGLRSVRLKPEGLFWNGKKLTLRAADRRNLTADELPELRRQGINALILSPDADDLWLAAERLGFVIIGRVNGPDDRPDLMGRSPALMGLLMPANTQRQSLNSSISLGIEHAGISQDEIHFFIESNNPRQVLRLRHDGDGELGRIV